MFDARMADYIRTHPPQALTTFEGGVFFLFTPRDYAYDICIRPVLCVCGGVAYYQAEIRDRPCLGRQHQASAPVLALYTGGQPAQKVDGA